MGPIHPSPSLAANRSAGHPVRGPLGRTRLEIEEAARLEGLWPVTEAHWKVIQFVRAYWQERCGPPALVRVARATGYGLAQLERLFPAGVVRTVGRLTGFDLPLGLEPRCPHRVPLTLQN